jgi:murein L,D-transpeptidase YcbB/YkuD
MRVSHVAELGSSWRQLVFAIAIIPAFVLVAGCSRDRAQNPASPPAPTPVSNAISALIAQPQDLSTTERAEIAALYSAQGSAPLWLDADGEPTDDAQEALKIVRAAADEGLDPADYDAETLTKRAAALAEQKSPTAADAAAFDAGLTRAMLLYLRHVHHGRVNPRDFGYRVADKADEHDFPMALREAVTTHRLTEEIASLKPRLGFYNTLRDQLVAYRVLAADAALIPPPAPKSAVKPGGTYEGTAALHRLLVALGDLPRESPAPTTTTYDDDLVEGVKRFQRRHGVIDDGVLGKGTVAALQVPLSQRVRQIELSLERLRWLPHIGEGRLIAVNIPMYRMWSWSAFSQDATPDLQMGVIVGKAIENETPVFIEDMKTVIFRPYWNVPASIVKDEILPAVRRDSGYIDRNDMEIVDGQSDAAKVVSVSSSSLSRLEKGDLRIRQRPGPQNSLGLVKFVFPNDDNVYMHGTPATQLFDRARRDFSHGCIRVEDPVALSEWVLKDKGMTREEIIAAMDKDMPTALPLSDPVQVVLFYVTAMVTPEDGALRFADDIYKSDVALDAALTHKQHRE